MSALDKVIPIKQSSPSPADAALAYPSAWRFCMISEGSKGPRYAQWNDFHKAFSAAQLPPEVQGIGLLHRWSGTASLDIDDLPLAIAWLAERGIDLPALLDADDGVQIVSGAKDKAKLLYVMPTGKVMTTKKIVTGGKTILEFRNGDKHDKSVQCCLPPTIHPVTCRPYVWGGKGRHDALPTFPDPLLKVWEGLLEADSIPRVSVKAEHGASVDEIRSAVDYCDPDSDRTPWVQVGMALKLELGDEGFLIWDEWSRKSPKYPGQSELWYQWSTFKPVANPVTLGTILHYARANGWQRSPVDVAKLFGKILKTPEEMTAEVFPSIPRIQRDLVPPEIGDYAFEVAEQVGVDPTVSVLAGIAAVAGAANAESTLYVNSKFIVRPILRCLIVADPSDKKSPGSKPMFQPLYKIEEDQRPLHALDLQRWEVEEAIFNAAKKARMEQASKGDHALQAAGGDPLEGLPDLPVLRQKPEPKRLVINDSTSQKAAQMLTHHPEGLLLYADEGRQWLRRATDPTSGDNLSFWTESYEGGYYALDRVGGGSTPIPNNAISLYANVQPSVLEAALPLLMIDGGQARFIFSALNTNLIGAGNLDDVPEWLTRGPAYGAMIRKVYARQPMRYYLSPEAREVFRQWNEWTTGASKHGKTAMWGKLLEGFVGKASGLALRIALVFHLASPCDAPGEEVSRDTMEMAIRFVKEFAMPQVEYIDKAGIGAKVHQWLANYILKNCESNTKSLSELRRVLEKNSTLSATMDKREMEERIMSGMEQLSLHGWVKEVAVERGRTTHWAISPNLRVVFAKQIEQLRREVAEYHFNVAAAAKKVSTSMDDLDEGGE